MQSLLEDISKPVKETELISEDNVKSALSNLQSQVRCIDSRFAHLLVY